MACTFFFKFSTIFNEVLYRWTKVEKSLQKSKTTDNLSTSTWSLKKRIYVFSGIALTLALIEHFMSLTSQYQKVIYEIEVCNWKQGNFIQNFISKHLLFVFSVIDYNIFAGLLAEYLNVSFTFYWSFLDIFITVVSIGIAFNYEMINNRIKSYRAQIVSDLVWSEIRNHYNEVSELLKFVNEAMDKIIILACCNDAYFIIIQLLNLTS